MCRASRPGRSHFHHCSGQRSWDILEDRNGKATRNCFTGDPKGFRKQCFPSNFFAERNTALGHGQDTRRCVRRKHMETDQDRTGMNSSPRDLHSLASDTQTLPVHGPERVFLVLT